jgi:ABC-2 type transport system permease protein
VTAAAAYTRAALAVFKRDFLIFTSYRARPISQFLGVAASVTLFFYVSRLVDTPQFRTPAEYFTFVVVGLALLRAILSAFNFHSSSVRHELVAGTFERMLTSPFGATAGTVAMLLFPFTLALFLGLITVAFAAIVFGVPLEWPTLPLVLPASVLAALAFAPFPLVIAALVIVFKQATGASRLIVFAVAVVSGALFPVELLPGWLRWASDVQPFTPAIDMLRHLLVGTALEDPASVVILKVIAFAALLLPLSVLLLRTAIEWGRRRATIIEY